MIVDLFAGPGGWDTGARMAGMRDVFGIELARDPYMTGVIAGHTNRILGDVAALDPAGFGANVHGIIASPPCQGFSQAGLGQGRTDGQVLAALVEALPRPDRQAVEDAIRMVRSWRDDPSGTALFAPVMADSRSHLVLEPLRWVLALRPSWTAWEQVPAVLGLWRACMPVLEAVGYSVQIGILRAEQYGVPQTRRRAFLVARNASWTEFRGPARLPSPTHSAYYPDGRLDPGVKPWVSMADALGWDGGLVGFPRLADRDDRVTLDGVDYRERDFRSTDLPAQTVTEKARSWVRINDQTGDPDTDWEWPHKRPATTVAGRGLIANPGTNANRFNDADKSRNDGIRVTVPEAAMLQTFPADYPWQGSETSQFQQIGDAVPPLLARAVLSQLVAQ